MKPRITAFYLALIVLAPGDSLIDDIGTPKNNLGGGFKDLFFNPSWGNDPI